MSVKPGLRLGVYVFKDAEFVRDVARVMEYEAAYDHYRDDCLVAVPAAA